MYTGEASSFRQDPKSCMAYPPWIAIFSAIVVAVGLGIFAPNGIRGAGHINDGLQAIGVTYDQKDVPRQVIVATVIVSGVLMVILLLLSIWRSVMEGQRDKRGYISSAGAYMGFNAFFNFIFWCTIIWALIAFGVVVTATAASYATDRGVAAAVNVIKDKLFLVRDSLDSARKFVTLAESDSTLQLSPTLSSGVQDLKKFIGSVDTTTTGSNSCPYYCVDISELKFLSGSSCICGTEKLEQTREYAKKAVKDFIPALVGLFVTFIGSTWLLMNVVAQFSHTRADRRWSRRVETLVSKNSLDQHAAMQHGQQHVQFVTA